MLRCVPPYRYAADRLWRYPPHEIKTPSAVRAILLRAKPSAAIPGRSLGGPVVHRTTGSSA